MTGARIVGCTHINAQTAVLIETLVALGAQVSKFEFSRGIAQVCSNANESRLKTDISLGKKLLRSFGAFLQSFFAMFATFGAQCTAHWGRNTKNTENRVPKMTKIR